jgi:hypothetical protein
VLLGLNYTGDFGTQPPCKMFLMLLACQTMEKKSRGIVRATITGWYAEISAENAVAPVPAIMERKNVAAQVGQPANNPNVAPAKLPATPLFESR